MEDSTESDDLDFDLAPEPLEAVPDPLAAAAPTLVRADEPPADLPRTFADLAAHLGPAGAEVLTDAQYFFLVRCETPAADTYEDSPAADQRWFVADAGNDLAGCLACLKQPEFYQEATHAAVVRVPAPGQLAVKATYAVSW